MSAALSAACGSGLARPGPVVNTQPAQVGGTIAGIVKTADAAVAVPGRKVTVIEVKTGTRHDTTTAANGGYTIQVPRARIDSKSSSGPARRWRSSRTRRTSATAISIPRRDFVITMSTSARD